MMKFSNAMEVFKLLNKSNCRKCNEKTCLAFASKVYLGQKPLDQCPDLPFDVLEKYRKKQGEKSFKKTADRYSGLFEDLIDIFNGEKTENYYQSDISMVLHGV